MGFKRPVIVESNFNFSQTKYPYPPRLKPVVVYEGWDEIYYLSKDGKVVFGRRGRILLQSLDEWETRQNIGVEPYPWGEQTIQCIRDLDDGELLISTSRNEAAGIRGRLYRTIGYDPENPAATTFEQVLEIEATQADINNSWGISVYDDIVTVNEYGLRGDNGARRVYLSLDMGRTFTTIFDIKTTVVDGRPVWTDSAHVHTATYDPYFNRIWVVVGDNPNTATYYSDDFGKSWKFVIGSEVVQYTGIVPLPDCVVFGSDRAPNGLHIYRRGDRSEMPKIEPFFLLNDYPQITHVFQLPYKRDYEKGRETYFSARWARDDLEGHSLIMSFVDGNSANIVYEEHIGRMSSVSSGIGVALGPTDQGNVIFGRSVPGVSGMQVLKSPAPIWN